MDKVLSSPNTMVWQYFQALRRLCCAIELHTEDDKETIQQDAALGVILAVTGVEIFMNVYFRVLVDEAPYRHASACIIDDLENQVSLERKIKKWPEATFGRKLNFGSGVGQNFTNLKTMRNKLVHFSSSHESSELPGLNIHGMADTSIYSSLTTHTAVHALEVAENFICEIFRLRGNSEQECAYSLHSWTGRVPSQSEHPR